MMKSILSILLAAGALALVGCSSTPTRVDKGPIQAHTFSFMDTGGKPPVTFADMRPDLHPRIQDAITKSLAAKGLTKVASGGDVVVGYLIIVSDGVSTTALDDYFGYTMSAEKLQEKAHEAFVLDNKNPTPYPAGTLVIDIVDGKTFQLLKRNFVSRPIMRQLPLDERVARLQEAVDEALQGLRVGK
jgi:hypothetical protein